MKTIYDLDLHETSNHGNLTVTRVPGGWIYTLDYWDNDTSDRHFNSVFVPFSKEKSEQESYEVIEQKKYEAMRQTLEEWEARARNAETMAKKWENKAKEAILHSKENTS